MPATMDLHWIMAQVTCPRVGLVVNLVGALLGGLLGRAVGLYGPGEGAGVVMALLGALILLGLYRLLVARRASGGPQ
jgi:uncharacterized membrane protein YeaQ/YmgE (transglycosylase-associated protein family)